MKDRRVVSQFLIENCILELFFRKRAAIITKLTVEFFRSIQILILRDKREDYQVPIYERRSLKYCKVLVK